MRRFVLCLTLNAPLLPAAFAARTLQQDDPDCSGAGVTWGPGIGPPPQGCGKGPPGGGGSGAKGRIIDFPEGSSTLTMGACHPIKEHVGVISTFCTDFLSDDQMYFSFDDPLSETSRDAEDTSAMPSDYLQSRLGSYIVNALSPKCAANVITFICHSYFKPCVEVESSGGSLWVPSLLCESTCQRHSDIHKECLEDIDKNTDLKTNYDTQMVLYLPSILFPFSLMLLLSHPPPPP
jgi:hypothetical protein